MIEDSLTRIAVALEAIAAHVAQPVVAQPVVAQPVVAQPVVAQPVVTQQKRRGRPRKTDTLIPDASTAPAAPPAAPTPAVAIAPAAQPPATTAYTLDMAKAKLSEMMQAQPTLVNVVRATLASYGVARVSDLPQDELENFVQRIELA